MVLGPFTLETSTLGTQTQVFVPLCLPPTYLATTLPDLLVKTYEASKVLNEILGSFDAIPYLTSIMDLYFRKIISWVLSETLEASHVVKCSVFTTVCFCLLYTSRCV